MAGRAEALHSAAALAHSKTKSSLALNFCEVGEDRKREREAKSSEEQGSGQRRGGQGQGGPGKGCAS